MQVPYQISAYETEGGSGVSDKHKVNMKLSRSPACKGLPWWC